MKPYLNERARRIWAATAAQARGGGVASEVARASGLSGSTLDQAISELNQPSRDLNGRVSGAIRQAGGGKRLTQSDRQLVKDLQKVG